MENYTTNKEISTKLNQYYTSLGYCELSDSSIMYAIRKAEKAIAPETRLDKKYNRKYYEVSFLNEAFDYILKNHTFALKRNQEFDRRQKNIKKTKELLPYFDLLIGSSSTLGLTDVQFEKTAWLNMDTIINLSETENLNDFLKNQMRVNLKKRVNSHLSHLSFLQIKTPEELRIKEFLSISMTSLLLDFKLLIIKSKDNKNVEIPYSTDFLFDIKDFNKIVQRLYDVGFLDIENVNMPYLDTQTINNFVKNSTISDKSIMLDRLIKYRGEEKDFWKNYS